MMGIASLLERLSAANALTKGLVILRIVNTPVTKWRLFLPLVDSLRRSLSFALETNLQRSLLAARLSFYRHPSASVLPPAVVVRSTLQAGGQ